ncbi:FAD-dependent monooxygenase [Streptomyces sp. H27-C3]|uniref:FAD-dependent monooxygenase n=1 Tax=Streptomyces sp. H27-C3 TaxID=3046305 RepID=UPI0024BAA328|nr:FAD-dependent monooxygenase [Streptomyces sp. H27-C3]MDJ0466270.1 FAD-dependent monooxygenase [Streptomyces sp. H27-C3]
MNTFAAEVIIAGAGTAGLMLAGELSLQGVSVIVLDKLDEPMQQSRALGFSARTIEEFGQRGLLGGFGDLETIPIGHFGGLPIDYRILEGGNFGVRGVPQSRTEAIIGKWAAGLGSDIRRGHEVVGFSQDDTGVDVQVTGPGGTETLRAAYLVGCDGARSTVRRAAGIDFPGVSATIEMKMADITGVPVRLRPTGELGEAGMVVVLPLGPAATRVVVFERDAGVRSTQQPPTFEEVAASFQRVTGEDISAATPLWTSYFTDSSRQAAEYRKGRVFLAGDAAHIHMPIGAQGISAGVGDAVNLGWKLAAVLRGRGSEDLLDTYHGERHPVGARVVWNTLVQRTLYLGGPEAQPLRDLFGELIQLEEVQKHLVGVVTGLDVTYGAAAGDHPLLGRRLPDRDLRVDTDRTTAYELLQAGRPLLLDLGAGPALREAAGPWADRVNIVTADCDDAPAAGLLVRPDGYVAWLTADGSPAGLTESLTQWFGGPR